MPLQNPTPTAAHTDFSGLWIPLVTPFDGDAIDHPALAALTTRMCNAGVAGFVACGSTGEAAALTHAEEDAALATIVQAAAGLPVVMGASDCNLARMLERIQQLNQQPLAAVLVPPPSYIRPSQAGLVQWFSRLADASVHPLIIYDIPARTGAVMALETLRALARHPRIVAIKDCGCDANKTQALIHDGQLQVMVGEDAQIFSTLAQGGHGVIAASAHAHTEHFVELLRLLARGDVLCAQPLWQALLPHIRCSFEEPNPAPIKGLLAHMGYMRPDLRAPMTPASSDLVQRMSQLPMPSRLADPTTALRA